MARDWFILDDRRRLKAANWKGGALLGLQWTWLAAGVMALALQRFPFDRADANLRLFALVGLMILGAIVHTSPRAYWDARQLWRSLR